MSAILFDEKKKSKKCISSSSSSSELNSSDSDTDNSSELDEEEINKLHKMLYEEAQTVKSHYNFLKKMLYQNKMREVEDKLVEVRSGTAKEYKEPLQKLQVQLKSRLEVASALREFKLTNLKHKHEAGEQAIRQNFENDKNILYDKMKADLEGQIQRLEEERNETDFNASLCAGRNLRLSGCGRGKRTYVHTQPKKKPVVVSGPCIVYELHEHEQFDDWKIIKKSLIELKRKKNAEKCNKKYP